MKGRTPNKAEKQHMDRVSQLGCIVCRQQGKGRVPCEIHHVDGKTKPDAHFKVLPLCFEHHRMGSDKEPISRHPYKARFVANSKSARLEFYYILYKFFRKWAVWD